MSDCNKVILIGGGGMIGRRLLSELAQDVVVTSSRMGVADYKLDLFDFSDIEINFIGENDIVLLAAAISSPDICKQKPEYARAVNVDGTRRVIAHCLDKGAKVVFFSSDTVYGSTTSPVTEDVILSPAGDYAGMKAEIEESFNMHERFMALRLSYVISAQDKFTLYLKDCVSKGNKAEIFHPLYRNVVWIGDIVKVVSSFIDEWPDQLQALNIGGPDLVSRVDMAEAFSNSIVEKLNYEIIKPVTGFYDARPKTISLNTDQFAKYIGREPCDLRTAYSKEFNL